MTILILFLKPILKRVLQDQTGQTACKPCNPALCSAGMLMRKCEFPYKSVPPKCYPCNQCRRDYNLAGAVDCYA